VDILKETVNMIIHKRWICFHVKFYAI